MAADHSKLADRD